MNAIILSGGIGKKIWPYSKYHNKGMLKIGNKPIMQHTIEALMKKGIQDIVVVAKQNVSEIRNYFYHNQNIKVVESLKNEGSSYALKQAQEYIKEETFIFFGDCMIFEEDIQDFIDNKKDVLISTLHQEPTLQICAEITEDYKLKKFWGHPRGNFSYFAGAFKVNRDIISYLDISYMFNETKVGIGSPEEYYFESAINSFIKDGNILSCYVSKNQIFDVDKPWHILEANHYYNQYKVKQITSLKVGKNSFISDTAKVQNVEIGNNCYIGDNVILENGCIIENNTRIDQGAILGQGVHIGENCRIEGYCKIGDYSSIGNECIIGHTSEIIEAVLFDKVYAYHYGEYYGVIGTHTDLGAGTTCGTLRFDDGKTEHYVCGHREIPNQYSNACFIGDYSRTGVGTILLPGCKVGSKSIVGSGVILNEDVEDNILIYPKQELVKKTWNDDDYGW